MSKPLGEEFRNGRRNARFFPQLSGRARAIDTKCHLTNHLDDNEDRRAAAEDRRAAAEEKRQRRLDRNKKIQEASK